MFELNLMLPDETLADEVCPLEPSAINGYCRQALERQSLLSVNGLGRIEISVQMLDGEAMQALNLQYRQKNSATNVLSFESELPVLHEPDQPSLLVLGDIVFCPEVITSEARLQGKVTAEHWVHMLVHGTLHLCGYDHIEADDAVLMEELEIQILSQCGISNPYQIRSAQ